MTSYYDTNAEDFIARTVDADISEIRNSFSALLPKGGAILDAGCGSGRDTKAFLNDGFRVTAFDASARLADLASAFTGTVIQCTTFMDFEAPSKFDGVWACASLLHVPRPELFNVVHHLAGLLHPGGYLYASFKLGTEERLSDGRYFNDMTADAYEDLISKSSNLALHQQWTTTDARPDLNVGWLNTIAVKVAR